MPADAPGPLLVLGAGSIGCFVGGCLQHAGVAVQFVGRPRVLQALRAQGLTLTDLDGRRQHLDAAALSLHERMPDGAAPSLVLLCVKSQATADAARDLLALRPGTTVLSLQNGVANAELAQRLAPQVSVLPGVVAFNVTEPAPAQFHRGTSGSLAAQDGAMLRAWQPAFEAAGLPLALHADLRPLQWGKLLLNLNNPVNALSGLPLRAQLLDRSLRDCTAALIDEALIILRAAGIEPARVGAAPPRLLPWLLRLPTPVFRLLAARMLRIDAQARSSMSDDLKLGRATEVDALCGEVVRLAAATGHRATLNARMVELVRSAESGQGSLDAARLPAALGVA